MSTSLTDDRVSETTAIDGRTSQPGSADLTPDSSGDASSSVNNKAIKPTDTAGKFDELQNEKAMRKGDRPDGKHELQQQEVREQLPFAWSTRKKWTVLSVIFVVQCSMNCMSTLLPSTIDITAELQLINTQTTHRSTPMVSDSLRTNLASRPKRQESVR